MTTSRLTLALADRLVTAAGFEPTSVDASEHCVGCRRLTRRTIVGGPFYCPAHARRAIEVAAFYRDRDAVDPTIAAVERIAAETEAAIAAYARHPQAHRFAEPAAGLNG